MAASPERSGRQVFFSELRAKIDPEPLVDAQEVAGLVCFYHERLDLVLDDVEVPRVRTPWS